jgi:hypothetical protein
MVRENGEGKLERPLLAWLERHGRLRDDTIVSREFPWLGRRVDLATLTRSGRTTAYELKVRDNRRALQQAAFNKLAFDRSYVVTESEPTETNKALAREVGVGFILLRNGSTRVIQQSSTEAPRPTLRRRLVHAIRSREAMHVRH